VKKLPKKSGQAIRAKAVPLVAKIFTIFISSVYITYYSATNKKNKSIIKLYSKNLLSLEYKNN